MDKQFRQEYSIKSVPTDDTVLLENTLNAMSATGWELYSIYEAEQNSKIVYNVCGKERKQKDAYGTFSSKIGRDVTERSSSSGRWA